MCCCLPQFLYPWFCQRRMHVLRHGSDIGFVVRPLFLKSLGLYYVRFNLTETRVTKAEVGNLTIFHEKSKELKSGVNCGRRSAP